MSLSVNSVRYNPSLYSTKNLEKSAARLSSAKRIHSAADDAAGLAISEKFEALVSGFDQGTNNSYDMRGLLKTADGAMDTVSDSLLRIRELSVQAKNGIYTDEDQALLQNEVDQMIQHIDTTSANTQFNKKNLLDGSFTNQHTASFADGGGIDVSIGSLSSASLGISGYSVTGNSGLNVIDKALEQVNQGRGMLGALINGLDHTIHYTQKASIDQAAAKSRIYDTDYGKESISYNTNRILKQYQNFSLKSQMATAGNLINLLL